MVTYKFLAIYKQWQMCQQNKLLGVDQYLVQLYDQVKQLVKPYKWKSFKHQLIQSHGPAVNATIKNMTIYETIISIQKYYKLFYCYNKLISYFFILYIIKINVPMTTTSHNLKPSGALKGIKDYSYALADCIGQGFSSSVYKGQHDPTGQSLAIKVINMKMLRNKSHKDLLQSEISCLKKVKGGKNIIQLKDVFETINNTYIVTQLCKGGDLDKHLSGKKLEENKAVGYMKQIITGYLQIASKQIIHRDLKPANIFIQNEELKIADFGFAIAENDNKKSNFNVGSPIYMSPQALKYNQYSYKSDIWALGVIFYEMLFGKTPWRANTEKQLPKKMTSNPIAKLIPTGSVSSRSLQFLMKTLNPDTRARMSLSELSEFQFQLSQAQGCSYSSIQKRNTYSYRKSSNNLLDRKPIEFIPTYKVWNGNHEANINSSTNTPTKLKKLNSVLTPKTQCSENDNRLLTAEFLSQIHLCRFIYKIICNLGEVLVNSKPLKDNLIKYVYFKLNKILEMENSNSYSLEDMDQFRQSQQFKKIISVSRKYMIKYQRQLGFPGKQPIQKVLIQIYENLSIVIQMLWQQIYDLDQQSIQIHEKNIVLVDYLITTYLLIKLEAKSNLRAFHQKSKIQDIVQGNTHKVTPEHYRAIKQKAQNLGFV